MIYKMKKAKIEVVLPKFYKFGMINNSKENISFQFTQVFDQKSSQEELFEVVAVPVINKYIRSLIIQFSFLEGYNGTIFAYGQTGSGKTFSMSGAGNRVRCNPA